MFPCGSFKMPKFITSVVISSFLCGILFIGANNDVECVLFVSSAHSSFKIGSLRLSNDTRPISYTIDIMTKIHQDLFNYNGSIEIRLHVVTDTDRIILHARELKILRVKLIHLRNTSESELSGNDNNCDSNYIDDVAFELDTMKHFLIIQGQKKPLILRRNEEFLLKVHFEGDLRTDLTGFHRLSYDDNSYGEKLWIAATHFEPTYARRAFPCYDEPAFKATFKLSITHGRNYSAISNMPISSERLSSDNMIETRFLETPPMSVYNLAFVISNYKNISEKTDINNVTQRIFYPNDAKYKGELSLRVAGEIMQTMEEYLQINYSLPKMDHISLPDHIGEAMENWGLIIYGSSCLLSPSTSLLSKNSTMEIITIEDDDQSFRRINVRTAVVISHELVHQWFGNLVTLKWWSFVWLNEGLATHYSYKALELLFPEWNIGDLLMGKELRSAWDTPGEKPITQYVETESEIRRSFNSISYTKAAYVVRMMEYALTENTFRKGMTLYLKKFQFGLVDDNDFFICLQEAAIEDQNPYFKDKNSVEKVFKSWTNQPDYPLVTLMRHYENDTFTFRQESYKTKNSNLLWWIPIKVLTYNNFIQYDAIKHNFHFILPSQEMLNVKMENLLSKKLHRNDWVILNPLQDGLYRVNYDRRNWELIAQALHRNPREIPVYSRAQIIRDVGDFLLEDRIPIELGFHILSYLQDDDEFVSWNEGYLALRQLKVELEGTKLNDLFQNFAKILMLKLFNRIELTLPKDNLCPFDNYIRPYLFEFACSLQMEECRNASKSLFSELLENMDNLNTHLEEVIFCEGLKLAKEDEFLNAYTKLSLIKDVNRRQFIMKCLASSENPELLKFLLMTTLFDVKDKNSYEYSLKERSYILIHTYENPIGFPIAIDFLRKYNDEFSKVSLSLWNKISFMRFYVRNQEHKQIYLELLKELTHLGNLTKEQMEDLEEESNTRISETQQEEIEKWLLRYLTMPQTNDGTSRRNSKLILLLIFFLLFDYIFL